MKVLLLFLLCGVACSSADPSRHDNDANLFTIRHEQHKKCLEYDNNQITMASCSAENEALLWKWVSNHRLFHLQSQMCLGINLTIPLDPLKMVPCNSDLMLWWRCHDGSIYGASQYKLTEKNGAVTASFSSNDEWRRDNTLENVCYHLYREIYTNRGNSAGKPCEFPFLRHGTWHHDCIKEANDTQEWCATTSNYDTDGKWGYCLKPGNGCQESWVQNVKLQSCYQFNMESILTWKEAYISCQNQGADLLSISTPEELQVFTDKEDVPDSVWIGLNHLDTSGGWQWSDHTPLRFINWDKDRASFSLLDDKDCAILNTDTGRMENIHCEKSLPYICKKNLRNTESKGDWFYSETQCEPGWIPYNGFCYMLHQPSRWNNAEPSCKKEGADLISMHSLADIEMVVTTFQGESEDIWSGLKNEASPAFFEWSDGTETDFTYWDRNEPTGTFNSITHCVSFAAKSGRWHVKSCKEEFKYICKKKGEINDTITDKGCQNDTNSVRHGNSCYWVDPTEVPFGAKCNLTVTNKFEQEFLNYLMKNQKKLNGKYFWTSLRDSNHTGDYCWETADGKQDMTYSNWNVLEPASRGGCVAMGTGPPLGKWEVKDCKTFKAQSICKRQIGSPKPDTRPKPTDTCPEGWYSGSDLFCYKLFHVERILRKRTWEEAEGLCEEFGGHLASFTHEKEKETLTAFILSATRRNPWIWIGLNKRNPALHGSWQWSDDRPVSDVVLPSDFNEDDHDLKDCVAFMPYRDSWENRIVNTMRVMHCDVTLEWVCQVPKGTPLKIPEWYIPDWKDSSHPTIVTAQAHFWFITDPLLDYKEAQLYCSNAGSTLASAQFLHELENIQEQLKHLAEVKKIFPLTQNWWLSSLQVEEYSWRLRFIFGTHGGKDCLFVSAQSWIKGYIEGIDCYQKLPFICESRNMTLLERNTTRRDVFKGDCPKTWLSFGDKCFIKTKPKLMTYHNAEEECKAFGATLPTITSQREQDFITSLLPNMTTAFWIGLRFFLYESESKWIDDQEVNYTNFNPLLHSLDPSSEFQLRERNEVSYIHCTFVLNDPRSTFPGTWDTTYCGSYQYLSLCQQYKASPGKPTPMVVPEDVEYQGQKYKMIQKNVTWYEALAQCSRHDMKLASLTDQYHVAFLALKVGALGHGMWIGLSSNQDGIHYRWQDGKPVTVSRWSKDEEENEKCVYMDTDGFWKTRNCNNQIPGAFCYTVPEDSVAKPVENHTVSCPQRIKDTQWIPFRNSCYSFISTHKRWPLNDTHSRFVCRDLHPDAVVLNIRDEEENNFVMNELQPYRDLVTWLWLGMYYDIKDKRLLWFDETFVKYSNWRYGRPYVSNEMFYAGMSLEGLWDTHSFSDNEEVMSFKYKTIVACKIEMGSKEQYSQSQPADMVHEGLTYHIIQKRLTWNEAAEECNKDGSLLASVHSEAQQIFLESIVKQDGFSLWIGLSSYGANHTDFKWADNSQYDYEHIHFAQIIYAKNCILLDTKGLWHSNNCTDQLEGAICYKASVASLKVRVAIGVTAFLIILFLLLGLFLFHYKEQISGFSPTIHYRHMGDDTEPCLPFPTGHTRSLPARPRDSQDTFALYPLGTSPGITEEKPGEEKPMRALILLSLCSAAYCAAGLPGSAPQENGTGCPSPAWVWFNSSCYTLLHTTPKDLLNIEPAEELCKAYGANLISINTEEENTFILKMFQAEWKGPEKILLGMFYDSDDDTMKWFDQSEVSFTNWRGGEEKNHNNLITCATMSTITGLWHLDSCENVAEMATLCKKPTNPQSEYNLSDQGALTITLIIFIVFLVISVSALLLVLYRRGSPGFPSRNYTLASNVLPYTDQDVLMDTEETEDSNA
ncbi:lymphocyte antigen 75 [Xenopus tropicalis]|uniref:CD302 antigen n=3 Tax=Xenopus tropicalis TaxID=8364 RepID=A0A8J1IVW3_XENTR|nr:lymphocyte antigen 75 [Xenopus tropicalis]